MTLGWMAKDIPINTRPAELREALHILQVAIEIDYYIDGIRGASTYDAIDTIARLRPPLAWKCAQLKEALESPIQSHDKMISIYRQIANEAHF